MSRVERAQRLRNLRTKDVQEACCIIQDRLYFMVAQCRPKASQKSHFFSIDNILRYEPFFIDFGPLNLACLYKFCEMLHSKLQDKALRDSTLFYYTNHDPKRIANASVLIGCYQILYLDIEASVAYSNIEPIASKAAPFRDASMGVCTYNLLVEHCLTAVAKAALFKFLDMEVFNVEEYEYYERVECGDFNVIVPGKFIAFAGPSAGNIDVDGYPALTPAYYVPIWKNFRVSTIVRLNKKCYDKRKFTERGFEHYDLYYTDGTCPSRSIIKKFLQICENAPGLVAIHCKAGLGRTGSCVGCYMMKHYGWTAQDAIAWLRICRPGSVIGPQQHFLEEQQPLMWKEGREMRSRGFFPAEVPMKFDIDSGRHYNSPLPGPPTLKLRESAKLPAMSSPGRALPTDPGQDQGGALREAKRSPKRSPKSPKTDMLNTSKTPSTLTRDRKKKRGFASRAGLY